MLAVAAESMAPIVLMHMKGTPQTMNALAAYDDVVHEVAQHLLRRRAAAEALGVPSWNVVCLWRHLLALETGLGASRWA